MKKYLVHIGIGCVGIAAYLSGGIGFAMEETSSTQIETVISSSDISTTESTVETNLETEVSSNRTQTSSISSESSIVQSNEILPVGILVKLNIPLTAEMIQENVKKHGAAIDGYELIETPVAEYELYLAKTV